MNEAVTEGLFIHITGIVQGVGFRPFVYELATRNKLTGWVRNTSGGVEIEVNGTSESLTRMLAGLRSELPPLARIDTLETRECIPGDFDSFNIIESQFSEGDFIPVSPDVSICQDCQNELFDPNDRRYRYPFINCTNCGPRFSIVKDIPYDRPNTTMAAFQLCSQCNEEYTNPTNRRFHAQPIACPDCGPFISFEENGKTVASKEDALNLARHALRNGQIIAVKGLGGFHLACDASNQRAVELLRDRKKRSDKPFALMAFDLATVEKHCSVSKMERSLLLDRRRPIVLLQRKEDSPISRAVAPNQSTLGFMIAYTPLHLLLLEPEPGYPDAFVMTSGNLSEEPIAYDDADAKFRLNPLADAFLLHNRPIHMRVDDSVVRGLNDDFTIIRRSRGYAPNPIILPTKLPPILACGAELKNTFGLSRDNYAFISHHIGDLENFETLNSFEQGIIHYERLFKIKPEVIATDLHPDYLSTRYGLARAKQENLPAFSIQHHHAHITSVMADNGWNSDQPVIGLSYDGTGMGTDGQIWGGEILVCTYGSFQRKFHLRYIPLPGGDVSIRKPARMALAQLWEAGIAWNDDLVPVKFLSMEEKKAIRFQLDNEKNAPKTSSMGRLFDAASALLGVCQVATYEGQAAIELESIVDKKETEEYEFNISEDEINPAPMWEELLRDLFSGTPIPALAARFHNSIARLSLKTCQSIRSELGYNTVALSGGVWQNMILLERTKFLLSQDGFDVLVHHQLPTNDGGIALGQLMIASAAYTNQGKV